MLSSFPYIYKIINFEGVGFSPSGPASGISKLAQCELPTSKNWVRMHTKFIEFK